MVRFFITSSSGITVEPRFNEAGQGTGPVGSLYRRSVISKTPLQRILRKNNNSVRNIGV